MITNVKIGYNGRFGNQLFQFASLLGIADKIGCRAVIPNSNKRSFTQNTMDGKSFQSKFELDECFKINDYYFSDDIRVNKMKSESHFHFDDSLFNIEDFTNIDGYFQSDKYFKHFENDILNILTFRDDILENAKSLLPKSDKELVSLHVRRGDYTTPNPYHPVVSDVYLQKSIEYFSNDKYQFVVFSDDLDWCKDKWGNDDRFSFFTSDSHFVDFCAMTLCHHHIISNSSFSWWSSYLSKNENKKVLAPQKWFGSGYANYITSDLYREDMIIIDEYSDNKRPIINIFTICTGKYVMLFEQFYQSCQNNFLPEYQKNYFVFTDGQLNNYDNVTRIEQQKLGWPYDTMMRFKMFNSVKNLLDGDYVFFFNVNMHFLQKIGEEVLPGEDNDYLMGVNHPGFYDKPKFKFAYERRGISNFFIPYELGEFYYQGCFNGGRKEEFMRMSEVLEMKIDDDMSRGIIPAWHDESALNWYYLNKKPLILDSSYAYPETWDIPFDRKVVQLDKNKIGGHLYLRS
jgi:hypothetical protein